MAKYINLIKTKSNMGLFTDTTFEEARKLYYKNPGEGIKLMKEHAKTADDFRTLEAKAWEAGDKATETYAATERAKKKGEKKFNWF